MQLRLPGIAVQLFARVFSAGEINGNCRKIRLIKNSGATIKKRRPGVMLLQCIQYGCTEYQYVSSLYYHSQLMLQRIAQLFRKTFTPYPFNILFKRRGKRHRHRDFHHINGVTVFPGHTLHDMPPPIFQLLNKRAGIRRFPPQARCRTFQG